LRKTDEDDPSRAWATAIAEEARRIEQMVERFETLALRKTSFIRDLRLTLAISWSFSPGMLKSVRKCASYSNQYSFRESMRSILPYHYECIKRIKVLRIKLILMNKKGYCI
jgi:hypothetical protein